MYELTFSTVIVRLIRDNDILVAVAYLKVYIECTDKRNHGCDGLHEIADGGLLFDCICDAKLGTIFPIRKSALKQNAWK